MKTILSRSKTLVENNNNSGNTLSYVKDAEIIHPEIGLTLITIASLPKIIFTPVGTSEAWIASQRKEITHTIEAYLVLQYHQRESSIMGDSTRPSGQGKGILDFVEDFLTVFRGHRFSSGGENYLSKPLDITNVDYFREDLTDTAHLLVAMVTLQAVRLITQSSLPGDI